MNQEAPLLVAGRKSRDDTSSILVSDERSSVTQLWKPKK
uniref:Uncharacterized protein n=1 Tax=Candidatus Methanogaster sp. ANME-2c ERB4 TaxID=2759911 RepID=A0A7G9YG63_9EURY|nr:hypothetical protein JMDIOONB_00009 [Methanosarcinales archaeon ANME-2c ERB4]